MYVMALDQGTTSSRAIVFDRRGTIRSVAQRETTQHFPRPGWVEQDAREIWATQVAVAEEALRAARIDGSRIAAVGITNQRETTVIWDRGTGEPISNAIVWQDRRTAGACEELRRAGVEDRVRARTGLCLDPYFSATKIAWILEHVAGARERAEAGELAFGTVDSWLAFRLTERAAARHRRHQCQPHAAVRHPRRGLGRRAARPVPRTPLAASRGAGFERRLRRGHRDRGAGRRTAGGHRR